MMKIYKLSILGLLILMGFTGAFLSGYFLRAYFYPQQSEFTILNEAHSILINHEYLELPESKVMEYGMIRGLMQSSNDPYASFLEPIQHELESNNLQGSFGGIGVELSRNQDGNTLIFPIDNGPADRGGLHKGDQLVSVDDLVVNKNTSFDEINAALRGNIGSTVEISVAREPDFSAQKFQIKRERIHLPTITWRLDSDYPSVGIIKVNLIAESTPIELQRSVDELNIQGAQSFVIDLRDNGGGLLTAGVDTAKLFLSDGIIMHQQYRGEDIETFGVNSPGPLRELPIVILINQSTASAAEIIAGALQTHEKALLIGEPSYGKDSIQLVFDLEDDSSIRVTAAKWWIPGLEPTVGEDGIQPDILIRRDGSGIDRVLEAAVSYLVDK
jgi:carboxyl-terminal processing protease